MTNWFSSCRHITKALFTLTAVLTYSEFAVSQGFPNVSQPAPGTLIQGPIAPEMGRTTTIEYIGGYIVTIPEAPGSDPGDDLLVRAWDMSDPANPRQVGTFGTTLHPMNAHGTIKRGNQVYIGGLPGDGDSSAIEVDASGNISTSSWRGPFSSADRGGMMAPWFARGWWSYGIPEGNAFIELDGVRTAEWDHRGLTGVIGFPIFMGNLLIYASDQSLTGVATYDVSDPSNPVLLDVLQPSLDDGGGIGGYWAETSGHYIVFARRVRATDARTFSGVQVVDFSDPSNLRLHCSISTLSPGIEGENMYVGFQDEYVFSDRWKINMDTCEVDLELPVNTAADPSQYSRPMGNLLLTGGYPLFQPNADGMSVWVHQSEPDTRAPFVSYHIPQNNQTNYPVMAPISVHIPETLRSETIIVTETPELGSTQTLTLTEVGGGPVRIDYILSHTGLLTIDPVDYLQPNTTYELSMSGFEDAVGNVMAPYSFRFSTGDAVSGDPTPPPPGPDPVTPPTAPTLVVTPQGAVEVNEFVSVTASATDNSSEAIEYQFEEGGEVLQAWSTVNVLSVPFADVGTYTIQARARNSAGVSSLTQTQVRVVDTAGQQLAGNFSTQLYCPAGGSNVVVVNPDNDSITYMAVDNGTLDFQFERYNTEDPRSIAAAADGNLWVTSHDDDRIDIFSPGGIHIESIDLGYGSAPEGIVMSPNGQTAYVSLYGSGELARFNTTSASETGRIDLGPTPKALALTPDGSRLLVTRFISAENWGEIWEVNTATFSLVRVITLDKNLVDDSSDDGRGIPNYLSSVIVSGDGTRAYVTAKKDNTDRGLLNGIPGFDLDDDNAIRSMAMTIDVVAGQELRSQRFDFDNADSPSSLALSADGGVLFAAMQGINQVFAIELVNGAPASITNQLAVGRAPQGLCLDHIDNELFAKNFTDRSLSMIDISGSLNNPAIVSANTVSNEQLTTEQLLGKQLFYDAGNGRLEGQQVGKMSAEGYISCASCHIDGGHDGRTYDFTGRGEGIRNNISLKGRSGTRFGNVHWTANFDQIQDFEFDIRNAFRGSGFTDLDIDFQTASPLDVDTAVSEDINNLAAYVESLGEESLPRSPYRDGTTGRFTTAAERGQDVFNQVGCADCHSGDGYTDGLIHNVGTLRPYSGGRLGGPIPGIKTPSLLGVFSSAPYLHDGSAKTLEAIFTTVGGDVYQAESGAGNFAPLSQLSATYSYLREGQAVRLAEVDGVLDIANVDGGAGGTAYVRVRYGSNAGPATVGVLVTNNGSSAMLEQLPGQPQVDGQDVAFIESGVVAVTLEPGTTNTIRLWVDNVVGGDTIVIDDITVSHQDQVQLASAHTVAAGLDASDRGDLVEFLNQIDRFASSEPESDAPSSSPTPGSSSGSNSGASVSGGGSLGLWLMLLLTGLLVAVRKPWAYVKEA